MIDIKLLESIKLEEQSIEELQSLIENIKERYTIPLKVFWHSERFSKDCYICVYTDKTD